MPDWSLGQVTKNEMIMCLNTDDLINQTTKEEKKKSSAEKLSEIRELKRNDDFCSMATCIMQFPRRFYELWVLKPTVNFNEIFSEGIRVFSCEKSLVSSPWEMNSGRRIPTRDYSWLLDVLLGTNNKKPLFPTLEICFSKEDSHSICSLLNTIMADGDIKLNELWRVGIDNDPYIFTKNDLTNWFSFLKSQIPVRLVDENEMPPLSLPRRDGRSEDDYSRTMEVLGVYRWGNYLKEIWLCPKRIKEYADNDCDNIDWKNLFIIVYLHELAHAALDPSICVNEEDDKKDTKKYSIYFDGTTQNLSESASAFAMEESLANMIMLKYLEWYAEVEPDYYDLFKSAKVFVSKQINEYKLGLKQFDADVDWTKWRDYKSNPNKPCEKLEEWFNNCFNKGKYTKEMFNEVFD